MFNDIKASAKEHILVAAHRGVCTGNIPCNSIEAYKAAIEQGADIVEIDVAVSRDKKLFVFHPGMEYPHLKSLRHISAMNSANVSKLRYVNTDGVKTQYGVSSLDDVFELLKDKCYVNIDKFWTAVPEITECVRRHGMQNQVLVKTAPNEKYFDMLEQCAPELPYMPMIKKTDTFTDALLKRKINLVGAEVLFTSDSDDVVSDAYIKKMHEKGLLLWGNPIVYNYKSVIAAGHTDDAAVAGDKKTGWLWYSEKGFDIVQTDWLSSLRTYYKENGIIE